MSAEKVNEDFNVWSEVNKNDKIFLLDSSVLDDGRILIKLLLDLYEIKLFIPDGYPHHEEFSNYYVEGPATVGLWCNALNEFLLDRAEKKLSIEDVLNRIVETYIPKGNLDDHNQSMSSEDDQTEDEMVEDVDGDEMFMDDMMSDDERIFTTEWELTITRLKIQWRAKEAKLREEMAKDTSGASKFKSNQVKQIFSNPAASAILSNDLITVMEHEKESGISSQPIDDNIFNWIVKLSKFKDSAIASDLRELEKKFKYNYIELCMKFDMDLYPFYPPLVKVIRPRIKGINNENLTSFDFLKLFQLSNWNPASNMKHILEKVKEFLETNCRLDLDDCKSDPKRNPDGAYYDVEHSLLRLSVVSEMAPRGSRNNPPSYPGIQAYLPPTETHAAVSSTGIYGQSTSKLKSASTTKPDKMCSVSAPSSPLLLPAYKGLAALKGKHFLAYSSSSCIKKAKDGTLKKSLASKDFWAKGTGYGHRHNMGSVGWDVNGYIAAQKEKDRQVEIVLCDILKDLEKEFNKKNGSNVIASNGDNNNASSQQLCVGQMVRRSSSGEESLFSSDGGNGSSNYHSSDWSISNSSNGSCGVLNFENKAEEDIYGILEGSALIPFLEKYLGVDSFLEVSRHIGLYRVIIAIVNEIANQRCLVPLLAALPDQKISLYSLLNSLSEKANFIINRLDKVTANGVVPGMSHEEEENVAQSSPALSFINLSMKQTSTTATKNSNVADEKIAREISKLFSVATETLKMVNMLPSAMDETNSNKFNGTDDDEVMDCVNSTQALCQASSSVEKNSDEALAIIYRKCLKPLQFESWKIELSDHSVKKHHFASVFKPGGTISQQQIIRVAQELSSLSSSLPLDLASSIFVRTDEEKCTLMRALITGPEGTPYSNGCFVFDIFFPATFPKCPPTVHFQTTGGGTVRFNPNLYNCGKVCLSLLGTWNGVQGEQWTEMSTVLQILVSIQSLILISDPYFNEPGYEAWIGTTRGKTESDTYNQNVRINNIKYAMLDQLKNPCPGFDEVIKTHFYIKKKKIIQEVEEWAAKGNADLLKVVGELKTILNNLEPPNEDVARLMS